MAEPAKSGTPATGSAPPPWPAVVFMSILAAPILIFFNIVTGSGLVAAVLLVAQNTADSRIHGVITDSELGYGGSRWGGGPADTFCHGRFDSDSGAIRQRQVRVYTDGDCAQTRGVPATFMRGAGWPQPTHGRPPLQLDGLLGMSDGAAVGHPAAFWRSLWPFLFIAPLTVLFDVCAVWGIRSQIAVFRARQPRPDQSLR